MLGSWETIKWNHYPFLLCPLVFISSREIKLCKETRDFFAAIFRCSLLFSVARWSDDSLKEGPFPWEIPCRGIFIVHLEGTAVSLCPSSCFGSSRSSSRENAPVSQHDVWLPESHCELPGAVTLYFIGHKWNVKFPPARKPLELRPGLFL